MGRQIFYIDYPQEHQGDALHAYQCKFCKIDTVKINGLLEIAFHIISYSHLSFSFDSSTVCHCIFDGASMPPRFKGMT